MNPAQYFHRQLVDAIASYDIPVGDALAVCEPVASLAAKLWRSGQLSRGEARRLVANVRGRLAQRALEVGRPRLDRRCDDCAFRPDSPEMTTEPECMERILGDLDAALAGTQPFAPFYCHRGMSIDEDGSYRPAAAYANGEPVGAPLCSGWVEEMDRRRASLETKGGDS